MNAPTLIVGLGGTGSKIVLKVADMATAEEKSKIAFAVFDTDVNELSKIKKQNPFVHTIQTSTKLSVGEYLDIDTHCRDNWFPVNAILNSKTLTEGAGQVRAVSRMAFETAVRAGKMEELHKAIESLYKLEGEEYQQALRVIIVSSLAGGTGSGILLPVALYIKNYLATRFRQSANITRGFFLLPEVFYGVIAGQAERNNLKSNAYAALRELDAFMMKGDSTLPENFKSSVKIEFPCVSSDAYEEYNIRPYDFCFLFDAQNIDGNKLNSQEQYLDHAANCIYAQSIGPMNKRSNSSEDNVIRKLAKEKGRNRYAGAGTSMLIYPVEDVKKYMSLTWAKECISDQWLAFDKDFKALLKENSARRKQGLPVADIKAGPEYIRSVDNGAENDNPFATAIQNACAVFKEDGITRDHFKWDDYIEALKDRIKDSAKGAGAIEVEQLKASADAAVEDLPEAVKGADDWSSPFKATYSKILSYKGMAEHYVKASAHSFAYSIFRADADVTAGKEKFRLETYLRDNTENFIHPCAVRYFLYNVQNVLTAHYTEVSNAVEKIEKKFANFEEETFDDNNDKTTNNIGNIKNVVKVSLLDKWKSDLNAGQQDIADAFTELISQIDAYREKAVLMAVLEEGLEYVKELTEAFESFFNSFESKLDAMGRDLKIIEKKRENTEGLTARYVCASRKCLTGMAEKMPYTGGAIEIDSKLSESIYKRVRDYSQLKAKSEHEDYFSAIFDVDILNYFTGKLMESYATDVDLDIIQAIEKEAGYEEGLYDDRRVTEYVKQAIGVAKNLASPFIEKPLGEERDPVYSCAYNDKLDPNDDSPKSTLIKEQLKNYGGEQDADIPKNKILFYQSFYGLRANDLSKFAPPSKGETYDRSAGEYFKAYYELVSKIHPVPSESKVITPHIDRWWHNAIKMPDLDDENQEIQLNRIYSAFYWAFVNNRVNLFDMGARNKAYRLIGNLMGKEESSKILTVSNGTPCDQFYEVLDAMAIYPELVDAVLKKIEETIDKDIDAGRDDKDNTLYKDIEDLRIREADLEDSVERSIFEFPLLLKKSMTAEIYDETKALRMLNVVISETERLVKAFTNERDYAGAVGALFETQFDKFLANLEKENKLGKNIYKDPLFAEICDTIVNALEEAELVDEPERVRAKYVKLIK